MANIIRYGKQCKTLLTIWQTKHYSIWQTLLTMRNDMANLIRYGKQYKTLLTIWQTLLDMANVTNHD